MKELNKKINKLWQSQRVDMGKKGNLWMALFFGIISTLLGLALCFSSGVLDKVLCGYLLLAFSGGTITFIATYLFIYNKKKFSEKMENTFKIAYKVLLSVCVGVWIPILLVLKIIEIMLRRRARKIDNYEAWLIILLIDLVTMMLLWNANVLLSGSVASYIEANACFVVNTYSIKLFLFLSLLKVEWEIINTIILGRMNHYGMTKIKKSVRQKESSISKKLPKDLDLKKYAEEKKQSLSNFEEGRKDELKYDIAYQKTALWRFQLLCLIALFLVASFTDTALFEKESDAINVITVFTLIMLYSDKKRAWDMDVLGLKE